jgi:hypothetical protein
MSCGRFERAGAARVCSRARRILLAQALSMASELRKWRRGRVAQLARARRLQRQTSAISPSGGDQQEQPFAQVRPKYSPSSN